MSFTFFQLWSLLLTFVACAACSDILTQKIPNELIVLGLIEGFIVSFSTWSNFGWKWLAIGGLFCLGALGLMGLGDIKLWMMIVAFIGFQKSLVPIGGGALLFILYCILIDRKETARIVKDMGKQFVFHNHHLIQGQQGHPFAPFIFFGTIGEMVWTVCQ